MEKIYKEQEKQSKGSAGAMGQAAQNMKMAGTAIFDIIGAFIGPLAPILKGIASTLTEMLEGALKGIAKPTSEITKTMLENIKPTLQKVADWFGATWKTLSNIQGFDGIKEIIKRKLTTAFENIVDGSKNMWREVWPYLAAGWETLMGKLGIIIKDFFTSSPGVNISGNCKIGNNVYIGTNSSVKENISICDEVIIGMQSSVIKSINEKGIYIGSPVSKLNK
jgi:hypothetical protein